MVPILVLLTILGFLLVDWHLVRRRRAARQGVLATPFARRELFFHPGHSWVCPTADGLVSIGATGFAAHFAGDLCGVEMPQEGRRLRQGEAAWTLVSRRGRRLTQVMPLDGKVLAVNDELGKDPSLAQGSPLDAGWILRVRPRCLQAALRGLFHGPAATAWSDALRSALARASGAELGRVALDGGEWVAGFGDRLDDEEWDETRREFFPAVDARPPVS